MPNWLILCVWQSLLGEIDPGIRAIAIRYDHGANFVMRYYFDHEPTEDDLERIEEVLSNIMSHTSSNKNFRSVNKEALFSQERLADLDVLDGLIYARRE